jgi:SOUL heme-binding protein
MTRAAPVGSLPVNATHPSTRAQWRSWLARHHGRKEGVWLVLWKKASGKAQLDYDAAVEEPLCFGWIDSKPRTGWSRPNKLRVERAIAAGRMTSTGLAKIEAARSDGSWTRLDAVEDLVVPARFTRETLPVPLDSRVNIREIPARTMAVLTYSGTWSQRRYEKHEAALLAGVREAGLQALGKPEFARYNAPFTPWFLRRNEVMVEIRSHVPYPAIRMSHRLGAGEKTGRSSDRPARTVIESECVISLRLDLPNTCHGWIRESREPSRHRSESPWRMP